MKLLPLTVLMLAFLMGCYYGKRNETLQTADICYIQFNGNTSNAKVIVDEYNSFVLGENENPDTFKPQKRYSLQPGKHHVQVYKAETRILDQLIFIGNNETKGFIIP